jgi:hypothetical protein
VRLDISYLFGGVFMMNTRKMVRAVDAAIKRADSKAIAERIFYDAVSDRVFVTLFKGPRKTDVILHGRWFEADGADNIDLSISEGVKRLEHTPIG